MSKKLKLNFWQIWNMNVGFFGIQYSFGLQQSAVNPIYDLLGASPDAIPMLNLAGPITGLLVQPLIGAMSDNTWSPRWGRRKPYFFVGALLCSIALLLFPFSSSLWMAAGLLWILDAGNNTAMEPYRAFVADKLDAEQQPTGFLMQSFFTGYGQTLANLSLFIFPLLFIGKTGSLPTWIYASFFLGAICSIGSIWWSMKTTPEIPPTAEELLHMKSKKGGMLEPLIEIFAAIGEMPKVMWQLALVYMFQWYALFCYWQNSSKSIALSVWNVTPDSNAKVYEEAVSWTGLVNGWYNIVTFLVAFLLVGYAKKYGPKTVHAICLLLAAIGFLVFPHIENKHLLFFAITGFGIGWASMMGIPYLMVVADIPKERYGVYMGIINMMIVIPMIIQNLTFGYIMKHFLNNDARLAVSFAGVLLLISAVCTLFIKTKKIIATEI
ncbi:MFS transporter [Flavobacterium branchiophilum]|uniref:Maltose/moltooligosaccharide transporter n=1 Tax=Flavobacterium branchiophilum TaxID=55197 RepID=A0A543G4N8_9FLAO|nr:MFS transporter [Flavobacterium branchiophilum]OXA74469.1 MFS transporter [Flavobacterium branchiophilum] [Flavobacterium branchiophilum NBRC 15030 = ATCC 35035]TQM41039.1 maltose/moltooligosaccharide transporter [Flavobacterium branchiophilum]